MPKREENTPGELEEEIPPHHEMAETSQVPQLKTKLGCAISWAWGAHTQPRQPDEVFNFPRATSVPHQRHLSSAAASQHQPHSTNCSQNEQTSCEGLQAPTSTSQVTKSTTAFGGATITKASLWKLLYRRHLWWCQL